MKTALPSANLRDSNDIAELLGELYNNFLLFAI
jgi:hypothetical protein